MRGVIGDHAAPDAVGRARNIEQDFWQHAHGETAGEFRQGLGKLVGLRNVSGHILTSADEKLPDRPEPGALPTHFNLSFERLHAKQNYKLAGPAYRLQYAKRLERVAEH